MTNKIKLTQAKSSDITADDKAVIRKAYKRSQVRVELETTQNAGGKLITEVKEDEGYTPERKYLTFIQSFGSMDAAIINTQLNYLKDIVNVGSGDARTNAIMAMLFGLAPRNEMQGMLAAQIVATNHVAMRMLSRSLESHDLEGANHYTNRAHKAQSLLLRQLEVFNTMKNEGYTTQKVIVEKVEVQSGGKAIVGNVTGGGGVKTKTEE